ncbi:NUDIX domain-containing protein [Salininema proteolyticum]|uniref:NUDIX domain-containing protein n=1 Tax=Salininema proteolyticum TaxID=1607685 RepID=A0ABV8U3D4_9ACTN
MDIENLPFRQRAAAYVLRRSSSGGLQVLVFAHKDAPEAGIQVPGGGVEAGETVEEAALREAFEETGIAGLRFGGALGNGLQRSVQVPDFDRSTAVRQRSEPGASHVPEPDREESGDGFARGQAAVPVPGSEQVSTYAWLIAPDGLPDEWSHTVSSGADDEGMRFRCRFADVKESGLSWGMDAFLPMAARVVESRI